MAPNFMAAAMDLLRKLFTTPSALELLSALAAGGVIDAAPALRDEPIQNALVVLKQLQLVQPDPARPDGVALTRFGQDVVACLNRANA